MIIFKEIATAVNNYAPRLDEVEKVKFSMFVHNQWATQESAEGLNLSNEWRAYKEEVSA